MHVVSGVLLIAGAAFVLIGGIGVIRFGDFLSRTHAQAKAPTMGLILCAAGAALELRSAVAVCTLVLVVILQLITVPVGTHMLGRAAHGTIESAIDEVDELARDKQRWAEEAAVHAPPGATDDGPAGETTDGSGS
jgi:multicomponent Na+:H+ antiporter subunit G